MRARYARCPRLRWAVMDMRSLAFPDASFDVVLEKGTLDVLLVDEKDPWRVSAPAAAAMHRVLAEVTAAPPRLPALGWWRWDGDGAVCPPVGSSAEGGVRPRGWMRSGGPGGPGEGDILWPPPPSRLRSR